MLFGLAVYSFLSFFFGNTLYKFHTRFRYFIKSIDLCNDGKHIILESGFTGFNVKR